VNTRPLALQAGQTAWIARRENDGLPDELLHNAPVLVLFLEGHWAFIRDGARRQRRLAVSALDAGSEYQGRSGHWYAEDHPQVQSALVTYNREARKRERQRGRSRPASGDSRRHPEID
jgi:hypothetical protein